MKVTVKDINGKDQGQVEVKLELIENSKGSQAVHEAVTAFRAAQRSGTASTKTMGEVNGTGKKPWRQKGTGRARAGSFASPLWRGGGVVFGPKPRDFSKKISRKTKQLALRKALSARFQAGDVVVIDDIKLGAPKTKDFIGVLAALQIEGTALVIASTIDQNVLLASRNVPGVKVTTSADLNTYQVLWPKKLVITKDALTKVTERLG